MKALLIFTLLASSALAGKDTVIVVQCDTLVRPYWECMAIKKPVNQPVDTSSDLIIDESILAS